MSPKEMVAFQMKGNEQDFGIDGYFLQHTNYRRERNPRMWAGPKKTYLDDAVKVKAFMPPPNKYAIHKEGSLMIETTNTRDKSLMSKDKRRTLPVEIENYERKNKYPAPSAYKLSFSQMKGEKLLGCFKYEEKRSQFLTEAQKRGKRSPDFDKKINIKYHQVENKIIAHKYQKH